MESLISDFPLVIIAILSLFSITISSEGIFLINSKNIFASTRTLPSLSISPLTMVSIPISISLPVILIMPFSASMSIDSRIGIVVLLETAFITILVLLTISDLLQIIFIVIILLSRVT